MSAGQKIVAGLEEAVTVAKGEAFAKVTLKQSRGPTLIFDGKLLASTEWEAREGRMNIELWETRGGALIPVTRTVFDDSGREIVIAEVIEPGDEQEMRFAAMRAWDWTDRARSMVRDLGWKLRREID